MQETRHGRLGLDPWVGNIPWRMARQPTPVFLSGESPWTEEPSRLQSMGSHTLDTTEATDHEHNILFWFLYERNILFWFLIITFHSYLIEMSACMFN